MSFEEVEALLTSNNISSAEKQLQTIIKGASDVNLTSVVVIKRLLQRADFKIVELTAHAIAELAKNESNRNVLSKPGVLQPLLKHLQTESPDVTHQALRAIGNICFENEDGCAIVGEEGLLQILSTVDAFQKRTQPEITSAGWGVLVNLLTTSDTSLKASLKLNILDVIENVVKGEESEDAVLKQLLVVLNSVTDELGETHQQQLKRLCYAVIAVMKTTTNLEIGALCLEFLFSQAESCK